MTPETMKAIKIVSAGKAEIQTVSLPELQDHYILVKVNAVAINPTDWYAFSDDTDVIHEAYNSPGNI